MSDYNPRWDRDDDRHQPGHDERVDRRALDLALRLLILGSLCAGLITCISIH